MPDLLAGRYTWIIVTGAFGAFGFGWGTGSNDVANAFGTSVGAKTLSLKQAVMLAVVFEFTGAIVLGRVSAETIAGGIAKADTFKVNPPVYAYGMSIVLWLGFLWQAFASYMGWNVSATHSIIGGIIGFAMVWGGVDSVFWAEPDSTKIPPIKGVVPIIISWFFSPVFTGCASAVFYGLTRYFVLLSENSTERSYYVLPIMVFFTILIDIYFTFTKGAKKSFSSSDDWSDLKAFWISVVIAAGCSLFSLVFGIPFLRRKLRQKQDSDAVELANSTEKGTGGDMVLLQNQSSATPAIEPAALNTVHHLEAKAADSSRTDQAHIEAHSLTLVGSAFGAAEDGFASPSKPDSSEPTPDQAAPATPTWKERVMRGVDYDIHGHAEEDPLVAAIHANAEKWDPDTEFVFGFLQVVSAICVIFAHGAGEVGYMAGPLAVIVNVVENPAKNVVNPGGKTNPEIWVILIGAFGLVIGLATYGYKVCAAVGTQLAKITPSRGYAAELATSFVIMIAAQYSLPTSSSQCITGGIIGIALFEGAKGINFRLLSLTALSWIWTLLVMGLGTALIFSQGIYAPNRFQTLAQSSEFGTSYQTLCHEHYYCTAGQYLKDCKLVVGVGGRPEYKQGSCTNCTTAATKCATNQYLKGCGGQSGGTCTNCSSTSAVWTAENPMPKCPFGFYLTGCPGTCSNAK